MVPYTLEQLSDREDIRDAAMRYCRGVDRLDPECMKSAYWPDATDDHGNFNGNAHEFVDYCMKAHLRWKWTMHSIYNHQIELDDDGVHAREKFITFPTYVGKILERLIHGTGGT